MLNKIKAHIESWKKQCGYDIPFDYVGLQSIIEIGGIKHLEETVTHEIHVGEIQEIDRTGIVTKPRQIIYITELQRQIITKFASTMKDADLNNVYTLNGIEFKIFPILARKPKNDLSDIGAEYICKSRPIENVTRIFKDGVEIEKQ